MSENLTVAPLKRFSGGKKIKFQRYYAVKSKDIEQNKILTSIQGHCIITNNQKLTINSNLDLVNMNAQIKFDEFLSICSQDIERKQNFGVN